MISNQKEWGRVGIFRWKGLTYDISSTRFTSSVCFRWNGFLAVFSCEFVGTVLKEFITKIIKLSPILKTGSGVFSNEVGAGAC